MIVPIHKKGPKTEVLILIVLQDTLDVDITQRHEYAQAVWFSDNSKYGWNVNIDNYVIGNDNVKLYELQ